MYSSEMKLDTKKVIKEPNNSSMEQTA